MPTVALVVATAIWGSTFVLVKDAIAQLPPFEFLAIRFAIGAVVLGVIWPDAVRGWREHARAIGVVGLALTTGYGFQTWGLASTGATNAGFITGLMVVFTPVVAAAVFRRVPARSALASVAVATTGLVLLSLRLVRGRPSFTRGDLLVLVCAVAFAVHIVALGRFAPSGDVRTIAVGQLAVAAVAFAALTPLDDVRAPTGGRVWIALAVTALGATAFGFAVQTWVQSKLSPTRTAVLLTAEPVFAGLFGFWWLGERLSARGWLGAALILAAMLVADRSTPPAARERAEGARRVTGS